MKTVKKIWLNAVEYLTGVLYAVIFMGVFLWIVVSANADHKSDGVVAAPFTQLPQPICAPAIDSAEMMFHLGYKIIDEDKTKVVMLHPRTGNYAFFEFQGAGACLVAVGNPEMKQRETQ